MMHTTVHVSGLIAVLMHIHLLVHVYVYPVMKAPNTTARVCPQQECNRNWSVFVTLEVRSAGSISYVNYLASPGQMGYSVIERMLGLLIRAHQIIIEPMFTILP